MPDEQRLLDAFDDCLNRLKAGESVADCLSRYGDVAEELRPMLVAADAALGESRVPHYAQMRSRQKYLTAAGQMKAQKQSSWVGLLKRSMTTGLALLVGFAMGTTGLYYASASTLPGDNLYSIKRGFENVQLQMADGSAARYSLEEQFNDRRNNEAQATLRQGRATTVSFGGILVNNTGEVWQVGGFVVRVNSDTQIAGKPQPGYYVDVTAQLDNDAFTATQITVRDSDLAGVLVRVGDRWSINGQAFALVPETIVTGQPAAGSNAVARIRTLQSADVIAVSLTVTGSATSTPSATPTPTRTRTATATPTQRPTETASTAPTFTSAPQLTSTDVPKPTSTPTEKNDVSKTPESVRTEDGGGTHQPTEIKEPTKTDEPSKTQEPDKTQEPSKTPEPSNTSGSGGSGGGGSGGGGGGGGGGSDDGGGGH